MKGKDSPRVANLDFPDRMSKHGGVVNRVEEVTGMAVKAFVLIETATGKSSEVCTALEGMGCVRSVVPVCGPWDVIVVAEGETRGDLGDLVMHRIKPVKGITRTMTCLVTSEAQECGVSITDIVAGLLPTPCVASR